METPGRPFSTSDTAETGTPAARATSRSVGGRPGADRCSDAYNDVDAPDRVRPGPQRLRFDRGEIELPPHSLTVCTVSLPLPYDAGASTVTLRDPRDWR